MMWPPIDNHNPITENIIYIICGDFTTGNPKLLFKDKGVFYSESIMCEKCYCVFPENKYYTIYNIPEDSKILFLNIPRIDIKTLINGPRNYTELHIFLNACDYLGIVNIDKKLPICSFVHYKHKKIEKFYRSSCVLGQTETMSDYYKYYFKKHNKPLNSEDYDMEKIFKRNVDPWQIATDKLKNDIGSIKYTKKVDLINSILDTFANLPESNLKRIYINHLLLHPGKCDVVLKHSIMKRIGTSDNYKYSMYMAFRMLFLIEKAQYIQTTKSSRSVFIISKDVDEIRNLPKAKYNNIYWSNNCKAKPSEDGYEPCTLPGARGTYSYDKFITRLNIYTQNLLDGINWDKSALCGSTITACLIKNPLESYCGDFETYIAKYYSGNSDIDISVETKNIEKFDKIVLQHFAVIEQNAKAKGFEVSLEKIITETKHKYKIIGAHKQIEIFMVRSAMGNIAHFHLGCVRAYFDGTCIRALPTFITAAKTGMNIDIRWITCNKVCLDVAYKYYRRGFGIYLNKCDGEALKNKLNSSVPHRDADSPLSIEDYLDIQKKLNRKKMGKIEVRILRPSCMNIKMATTISIKIVDLNI
jgi:hypothetical protein